MAFAVSSWGPALTRLASLDACLERVGLAQRKTLVVPAQLVRGGLQREGPAGGALPPWREGDHQLFGERFGSSLREAVKAVLAASSDSVAT